MIAKSRYMYYLIYLSISLSQMIPNGVVAAFVPTTTTRGSFHRCNLLLLPPPSSSHAITKMTPTSTTRLYDTFALINIETTQQILQQSGDPAAAVAMNNNNYVPAATALFVNMLTPASILAAGMISIGLKSPFQLPSSMMQDQPDKVKHIEYLRRAYIVVSMISFCSELLAVMWATVAVNQLTERTSLPEATSVWDLLQSEFDLEWSAVNTHFVIGLIGFMYMVGIRGYIMLLTAEASEALIASTLSGVGAALLLMGSIVNHGIQIGSGQDNLRYGDTVLDLFGHYVTLLYQRSIGHHDNSNDSISDSSVGPLGLGAIILEVFSIAFAIKAIVFPNSLGRFIEPTRGLQGDSSSTPFIIEESTPSPSKVTNSSIPSVDGGPNEDIDEKQAQIF